MKHFYCLLLMLLVTSISFAQSNEELADYYYQQALGSHQQGKVNEAVRYYSLALDQNPYHLKSLYNRGVAYLKRQQYAQAEVDFNRIISITPDDYETLEHLANAKFYQEDYSDAVQIYDRLLVFKPNDNLYSNRGLAKSRMKDYESAIQDFEIAIQQNPHDNDYHANHADAYSALKQYDRAIQSYDYAAKINPYDAYVYNNRGNAKSEIKAYEEAVVDYNTAINIQAESQFYTNRAFSMLQLNRYQEAITDSKYALELESNNANAYYALGLANLRLQLFDQAVYYLDHAIRIHKNDSEFYRDRGLAHYYLGNYSRAILDCEQSLALYPQDYSVLHLLESARQSLGQRQLLHKPSGSSQEKEGYYIEPEIDNNELRSSPRYKRVAYRNIHESENFDWKYITF